MPVPRFGGIIGIRTGVSWRTTMRLRAILVVTALLAAALAPLSAEAASRATARASGDLPIRTGPGVGYAAIGTLRKGAEVHLQRCTRDSGWCLFLDKSGEPVGWVRGSYLVGSGAKLEVTPHRFLGFDPLDPLGFCGPDRNGDWDDSNPFCEQ
ncbi:MAG: SH3 domain-containing protein [Devosia sp.]|nr:SH3 domain-containing protein [Devosia sp.]